MDDPVFGAAFKGILYDYLSSAAQKINRAAKEAVEYMESATKSSAPYGRRKHKKRRPHFRASIASRAEPENTALRSVYTWYVKKPNSRITHLIENEHRTRFGSFGGYHFVRSAYTQAAARYEQAVAEALEG